VLFLCPIGVRNAAEAATATAIRNGSGLTARRSAMVIATGAATMAVAVLLRMSDSVIVTTISTVRIAQAGQPSVSVTSAFGDQRGAPRGLQRRAERDHRAQQDDHRPFDPS
jgi:hypothetical protein